MEGETEDRTVNRLRRRQARSLLATLLLSTGVPMLWMGDELRHTQAGNNNAYCQPGLSALDWDLDADALALRDVVRRLVALRRAHPVLRQTAFFHGLPDGNGAPDVAWFGPDGAPMTDERWSDPSTRTLAMYLGGDAIRSRDARGNRVVDDSFLLLLHSGDADTTVSLPGRPCADAWEPVLDTADEEALPPGPVRLGGGTDLRLAARSVVLLRALDHP